MSWPHAKFYSNRNGRLKLATSILDQVGNTAISATAHSGSYAAQIGSTSPYRGDSWISQNFNVH